MLPDVSTTKKSPNHPLKMGENIFPPVVVFLETSGSGTILVLLHGSYQSKQTTIVPKPPGNIFLPILLDYFLKYYCSSLLGLLGSYTKTNSGIHQCNHNWVTPHPPPHAVCSNIPPKKKRMVVDKKDVLTFLSHTNTPSCQRSMGM